MAISAVGVVLAGGRSERMGADKAWLDWHGATLLERAVGTLTRALDGPVLVVRGPGQRLPTLPPDVLVLEDPVPGRGPLQGLAVVLAAAEAPLLFAAATDLPLLHPLVVRCLVEEARAHPEAEVVLPVVDGRRQHLAAVYRTGLGGRAERLLHDGRTALADLVAASTVRDLTMAELSADPGLAAVDPDLRSFRNLNTPAEYKRALALEPPEVTVRRAPAESPSRVAAAHLGAAAEAVGCDTAPVIRAMLGGTMRTWPATTPLFAGDSVVLGC